MLVILTVCGLVLEILFSNADAIVPHVNTDINERDDGVRHLIGEPDFRDVRLRWKYLDGDTTTFQVRYCELQAWGQHRCRIKVVDGSEERSARVLDDAALTTTGAPSTLADNNRLKGYSARITGLRMATTYSFEVRPVRRQPREMQDNAGAKVLVIPTKGSRATQCLPHASEVEVSTGPYFGGRIAVEAADGGPERCSMQGNPSSAQDAYILRINHLECGSDVNDTTVATYVIVQENLPILTHSTRRFLVLCTYKPETLTVRAGINLPKSSPGDVLRDADTSGDVEPYAHGDYNELQPARLQARNDDEEQSIFGEIGLVMLLVAAAFGGVALLIWRLVPASDRDNMSISSISSFSRSSLFSSRNRDRFSDRSSVYSISLSEKDNNFVKRPNDNSDNTSEA